MLKGALVIALLTFWIAPSFQQITPPTQPPSSPSACKDKAYLSPNSSSFHFVQTEVVSCFTLGSVGPSFGTLALTIESPGDTQAWIQLPSPDGIRVVPGSVDAPMRAGRRPIAFADTLTTAHIFETLPPGELKDLTVVILATSRSHPKNSTIGISVHPSLPQPHCDFVRAVREQPFKLKSGETTCQSFSLFSDAPFASDQTPQVGLIGVQGMFVAVRTVMDDEPSRYSPWEQLHPIAGTADAFFAIQAEPGVDHHYQFVAIGPEAEPTFSFRFRIGGLLTCQAGFTNNRVTEFKTKVSLSLQTSNTQCFWVQVPSKHDPGNYIEALLESDPLSLSHFKVFARYETSRPWNQISLSPEATSPLLTQTRDSEASSSYKVPVPQQLIGTGKNAIIMVAAPRNAVVQVTFRKPEIDCRGPYSDQVSGYAPKCPTTGCKMFETLEEAKGQCNYEESCHSITKTKKPNGSWGFQTRTGAFTLPSSTGEVSYFKHERANLGQLLQHESIAVESPLCVMVNLGDKMSQVSNADLAVTVQARNDEIVKFYRAYSRVNGQWQQMVMLPKESPSARTFSVKAGHNKTVGVAIIASTLDPEATTLSFDTRESAAVKPAEMIDTCHSTSSANPMPDSTTLELHPNQASCVSIKLPERAHLFKSLRVRVTRVPGVAKQFGDQLPTLVVKSKETATFSRLPGTSKKTKRLHGFLQVLKMIRERIARTQKQRGESFWAVVPASSRGRAIQTFNYQLPVSGQTDAVSFMLAVHNSAILLPDGSIATGFDQTRVEIEFELVSPLCSFQERVPLGRRVVGRAQAGKGPEMVPCYLLALSKQNLLHSDLVFAKLSPSSTRSDLDLYVQRADSTDLGDKLPDPTTHTDADVSTYGYCATRDENATLPDPCDRVSLPAKAVVLRVAVVARTPTPVPFSLKFLNFGPSCKFPMKTEMEDTHQYEMTVGSDSHICYEVRPRRLMMGDSTKTQNSLTKKISQIMGQAQNPVSTSGTFTLHIEPHLGQAASSMAKLRVYARKPGSDVWQELSQHKTKEGLAEYTVPFGLSGIDLAQYFQTMQSLTAAESGETKQTEDFARTFQEAMAKPSFLSISSDSAELVQYTVWFSEDVAVGEDSGKPEVGGSILKRVIFGIVALFLGMIVMIVRCVGGSGSGHPDQYQRIDRQTVDLQKFQTLQVEDEDLVAGSQEDDEDDDIAIQDFEDDDLDTEITDANAETEAANE